MHNPENELVQKYADKLVYIRNQLNAIREIQANGKIEMDFDSPVWTLDEMEVFEQQRKLKLPDEYKVCLLELGEINQNYFRTTLNLSLRNRLGKEYAQMAKKAILPDKVHPVGSLYGNGWINEKCFDILKDEDKFRLYRQKPLFATDAGYDKLFKLKSWNTYQNGCLLLDDGIYLILNGYFEGEIWKYGSEPEGEYAPSRYRECFTPVNEKRPHLLDFIIEQLDERKK